MSFIDKYPKLKEKQFLIELVTRTVFSTMALENQNVDEKRVKGIVLSLLEDQKLKLG